MASRNTSRWDLLKTDYMNLALFSLLIETTIPARIRFNEYGVVLNGLRYDFNYRRLRVKFELCSLNGIWGGAYDIFTNAWGCGGPIIRQDFKFRSFEECADYLWKNAYKAILHGKENIVTEFPRFKSEYKKWLTLTVEQKYSLFKEAEFYDTL